MLKESVLMSPEEPLFILFLAGEEVIGAISFRIKNFVYGKGGAGALIAIGILLRLKHYFENRSLWLDEAWLSCGVSKSL